MPYLLHKVRKSKWNKEPRFPWLDESDLEADALADLNTSNNALSVWHVNDDRSNFDYIVAALAATTKTSSNFDYALLHIHFVEELGLKIDHTPGKTPDASANAWHRDIPELSATRLLTLAQTIRANAEIKRIGENDVIIIVDQAVKHGRIGQSQLSDNWQSKLGD